MENYHNFLYVSPEYRLIENDNQTKFNKVKIVGCFTMDGDRNFKFGADNLHYFKIPKSYPLDLNVGSEKYKPKTKSYYDEAANSMLNFLMEHESGRVYNDAADFITYRGKLSRIMSTPYLAGNKGEGWSMKAAKYKGRIYMSNSENDIQFMQQEQFQTLNKYTQKFKEFCFSDHPDNDPDRSVPLEDGQQFFCVYQQRFCGMNLLYAADVDGVLSKEECDLQSLDNTKLLQTKIQIKGYKYNTYWRKIKLLRWWTQSSILGIENLIVGSYHKNGLIHETPTICKVSSLPTRCDDTWKPHVCLKFLSSFLFKMKQKMQDVDSPHTMYEFRFFPKERNICFRVLTDEETTPVLNNTFLEFLDT